MIIMITGGARSGKSSYALQLALQLSNNPVYVATARRWDNDFEKRIRRHQQERDDRWTSVEEEKYISHLGLENKTVVIDCVTLWLTNFFVDHKNDIDACLQECKKEIDTLKEKPQGAITNTSGLYFTIFSQAVTTESPAGLLSISIPPA